VTLNPRYNKITDSITAAVLIGARSKNKPMNQHRRIKDRLKSEPPKDRGKMPPPSIRHKDKREKNRQDEKSDLRRKHTGSNDELLRIVMLAKDLSADLKSRPDTIDAGATALWIPLVFIIKKAFMRAGNKIYGKLVSPHLDDIYDDHIEEAVELWCETNNLHPCDVPRAEMREIGGRVVKKLEPELRRKAVVSAFGKAAKAINPINVIRAVKEAILRHGLKVGLKVAAIVLIGDLIIPALGGLIHPSLFAFLSLTPQTEIALAALAVMEGIEKNKVYTWLEQYESATGEDLVSEKMF